MNVDVQTSQLMNDLAKHFKDRMRVASKDFFARCSEVGISDGDIAVAHIATLMELLCTIITRATTMPPAMAGHMVAGLVTAMREDQEEENAKRSARHTH